MHMIQSPEKYYKINDSGYLERNLYYCELINKLHNINIDTIQYIYIDIRHTFDSVMPLYDKKDNNLTTELDLYCIFKAMYNRRHYVNNRKHFMIIDMLNLIYEPDDVLTVKDFIDTIENHICSFTEKFNRTVFSYYEYGKKLPIIIELKLIDNNDNMTSLYYKMYSYGDIKNITNEILKSNSFVDDNNIHFKNELILRINNIKKRREEKLLNSEKYKKKKKHLESLERSKIRRQEEEKIYNEYWGWISKDYDIYVIKPKIQIERDINNKKAGTFDFIRVEFRLCRGGGFEEQRKWVSSNKKNIVKSAFKFIEESDRFKKYNVPINFIKATDIKLTQDSTLIVYFNLREA